MHASLILMLSMLMLTLLLGCDSFTPLNTQPPAYIKQLTVLKEGYEAMLIYVILADSRGAMTTGSGTLDLSIIDSDNPKHVLYHERYPVTPQHFRRTSIGVGAYAHEAILVNIGRIPYQTLNEYIAKHMTFDPEYWAHPPSTAPGRRARVRVVFESAGHAPMTSEESFAF
jgi:hypothetical protein